MDQVSPSLQGTSSQPLKSLSSERSPSPGNSSGGYPSSEPPCDPIGDSWLSRPNLGEELRRYIYKTNQLSIVLSDDQLDILFGCYSQSGSSLPALFTPNWSLGDAAEGITIIEKVMKLCGPIIKDLQIDVDIDFRITTPKQLVDDQKEPGQRVRNQWLWNVASITQKANIINFVCRDEETWDDFIRFLTSQNHEVSDRSSYPWPDMQALHFHGETPSLVRYGQRALATYLAKDKFWFIKNRPALSKLRVPGSFYRARDAETPGTQWMINHVQPRAEDDNSITAVSGSILRGIIRTLL